MEPTITTLEELIPHVRELATAREFGAAILQLVPEFPRGMRQRLARAARDVLGRPWSYATVRECVKPTFHSEERRAINAAAKRRRYASDPRNAEVNRKKCREWYDEHRDRAAENSRRWREENAEHVRDASRRKREENPDAYRERHRSWRERNPERAPEIHRARRAENREHCRNYLRDRYANDPAFRLGQNLRNRVRDAIRGRNKSASTMRLVGCSIEELMAHIETQFAEGMSWGNMDEWHLDHRRPCASFDLTDPAQQRECFHWSNLQPLWAKDNLAKGSLWNGVRHRVAQ